MASAEEDEASRRLWKSLQHASHFRCVSGLTHVKAICPTLNVPHLLSLQCVFSISMVLLFPLSIWLLHNSSQPGDLLIDGHLLCDFNGLHCLVFCSCLVFEQSLTHPVLLSLNRRDSGPLRCAIALCHLLHRVRLSSNQLEPLHLFYFFLLLFSSTLLLVVSRVSLNSFYSFPPIFTFSSSVSTN